MRLNLLFLNFLTLNSHKMRTYTLIILTILISVQIVAQKAPIKWKKVPIEDLKMTKYERNPSASAVVLCDYGRYYFDTNPNGKNIFFFQQRHVRIKILKKEGLKYAKISIPFMNMDYQRFFEEVDIVIKGMTYNLNDNNELEHSRLKAKDITYRDSTKSIKIAEFTMPDVRVGSVIDYYYTTASLDFINLPDWNFQTSIPVIHSELRFYVPRYFQYVFNPVNFTDFDESNEDYYSRTLFLRDKRRRNMGENFDMSGKLFQFVKRHNPAIEHENFVINEANNIKKLKIHLQEATNEHFDPTWARYTHALFVTTVDNYEAYQPIQRRNINYPAGYIVYRLGDWEETNNKLLGSERLGLPMIKHWKYKPHLDSIVKGKTTEFDKMLAVYDYIRKNIKWNGKNSIYVKSVFNPDLSKLYTRITKKQIKEKSLQRPFDAKKGSSSEINLILISLLKKLGIETNAVLLSRRDMEQVSAEVADAEQFNNVIAMAKIGDKTYLLDATDSLRPYKFLDKNQLVDKAFMINSQGFKWIKPSNIEITKTVINDRLTVSGNLDYKRNFTIEVSGYDAIKMRRQIKNQGKISTFYHFDNINNAKIQSILNADDDSKNLIIKTGDFSASGGDKIAIKLNLKPKYNEADFNQMVRKHNVEFEYPYKLVYNLHINLPNNLKVKTVDNKSFSFYNNQAGFEYKTEQTTNQVKVSLRININDNSFPHHQYHNLKQLFSLLKEQLNEAIIIEK